MLLLFSMLGGDVNFREDGAQIEIGYGATAA